MKKTIFTFMLVMATLAMAAQEHLSFKGIPIEGSMTEFCEELSKKGLLYVGKENNVAYFQGDFTGKNATIGVAATDDGENVFAVGVMFDASDKWKTLVNTYDYYKELYTRKYGKPTITKERNPSYSETNTSLMAEVHNGRAVWFSSWEVTGGIIELSIEKASGVYIGTVVIKYRDSQNTEAKIQQDLEEI